MGRSPSYISAQARYSLAHPDNSGDAAHKLGEKQETPNIYGVLFELAPDALITTDQDGRVQEVNIEAERQFGYEREELIGKGVESLIPERLMGLHERHREVYQPARTYGRLIMESYAPYSGLLRVSSAPLGLAYSTLGE